MSASISASVGQGGYNRDPDVRTVQSLLNRVPSLKGGPSVPLKVDGLCYGKTLAAIQDSQRKSCRLAAPDSRVDPSGRTWTELAKHDQAAPAGSNTTLCFPPGWGGSTTFRLVAAAGPAKVTADSLVGAARSRLVTAITWVTAARTKLAQVRASIERYHVYTPDEIRSFKPIETHFKVRIPSAQDVEARDRVDRIAAIYARILQALGQLSGARLVGDPSVPHKAMAPLGGFSNPSSVITIGADFANSNANMQAAVLIHECAHFVERACLHVASELPAPQGSAITDGVGRIANPSGMNHAQMDFSLAIQNAYSFAQCALHNGVGLDKRPP
ncbi:hypothetical protein ACFL5O_05840 [Myxococcota bacterium]